MSHIMNNVRLNSLFPIRLIF